MVVSHYNADGGLIETADPAERERGVGDLTLAAVTVLLPTYNRCTLIDESIRSILGQTLPPSEIIVIDDGSTDDTERVVRSFAPRVTYVRKDNGGKSTALNHGLALVSGDFILVMDDDDLLPPTAIARHVAALTTTPGADFSYGRFSRFRGDAADAHASTDVEPVPAADERRLAIKLMERCYLTNPTWMVRAAAQRRAGRYSEELKRGQDFDMLLRLARDNEGVFIDDLVLWQREHVAERGPSTERVTTDVTIDLWIKYNRLMLETLDQNWCDADFRPHVDRLIEGTERLAVLQRSVLMMVHRVYDRGIHHLDRYLAMLGDEEPTEEELFAASYLLGNRHGIDDLFVADNPLAHAFATRALPRSLRLAFAFELRWRLIRAVKRMWIQRFKNLVMFGIGTFGPGILMQLPFQNWSERRRTCGLSPTTPVADVESAPS